MARRPVPRERTLRAAAESEVNEDAGNAADNSVLDLPPLKGANERIEPVVEYGSRGDPDEADTEPEAEEAGPAPRQSGRAESATLSHPALRFALKALAWAALSPLLFVLPFILALRITVIDYQKSTFGGWESAGLGIVAAMLLICVYIAAFMWTFRIRRHLFMYFMNISLAVVLCYSGYALFHLGGVNAKTEEVRSYYTTLHPLLRVAVKNLTLVDEKLVVTDVHRTPEDYKAMGMEPRDYSLHFRQPTGFVHAVDLRTNGRPRVENLLVELYFLMMGFETLRHVGTSDHLHVSLPLNGAAKQKQGTTD